MMQKRMIIGHTTQRSGEIAVRCGGKLIGIDTGISKHYGSSKSILEINQNDAKNLYTQTKKYEMLWIHDHINDESFVQNMH